MTTLSERIRTFGRHLSNVGVAGTALYVAQKARISVGAADEPYIRLQSKHAAHPLWARPGTSDLDVFCQIFRDREYECLDGVVNPSLVIDCGANVGYASAYFLSRFPSARVISVEPDPDNFAALKINVRPFGDRCQLVNTGIWSSTTGLVMDETAWGDGREWARTVRPAKPDEIPVMQATDIGALLTSSGHERISILKIDIEGAEGEVFSAGAPDWLARVDNLVIELHGSAHEATFHRAIAGAGFEVSSSYELTVCRRRPS
ncbi:MAG: FkbM family methyltransferase [Myxococcus sp.]|nr:FkbM family methyltransferase [Myxococcus sp.]